MSSCKTDLKTQVNTGVQRHVREVGFYDAAEGYLEIAYTGGNARHNKMMAHTNSMSIYQELF